MTISYNPWSKVYKIDVDLAPLYFEVFLDSGFFNPLNTWTAFFHNHGAYEVQFVLKHRCKMFVDARYYELHENSYCVIPPHTYHSQLSNDQEKVEKLAFTFQYKWVEQDSGRFHESEIRVLKQTLQQLPFLHRESSENVLSWLTEVQAELQNKNIGYMAKIQSLFTQVLLYIFRDCLRDSPADFDIPPIIVDDERVNVIDAFFICNYGQSVREKDLADLLKVSSRQLNRILRVLYNTSFRQKLLETRVRIAMDMLAHTKMPVHEIAENVGYLSVENFHFAFKKEAGTTPAQFRKQFVSQQDSP